MFSDKVRIFIKSGKGGDGHVSFRRELYVPAGGPDGGNGGHGGDIIFQVDKGLNTLGDFRHNSKYIAQSGEEGRGIDVHAAEQVVQGKQTKAVDRHLQQIRVVAHKGGGEGMAEQLRGSDHHHGGHPDDDGAFPKDAFQLAAVVRSVVEADNGRTAHGEAQEGGDKDKVHVHHHRIGGHTRLSNQAHQLEIVEDADDGGGDVAHQFG